MKWKNGTSDIQHSTFNVQLAVCRPGESGGERAAVQTLREIRRRLAVAKRLDRRRSKLAAGITFFLTIMEIPNTMARLNQPT
jgi:hypothetical protein